MKQCNIKQNLYFKFKLCFMFQCFMVMFAVYCRNKNSDILLKIIDLSTKIREQFRNLLMSEKNLFFVGGYAHFLPQSLRNRPSDLKIRQQVLALIWSSNRLIRGKPDHIAS